MAALNGIGSDDRNYINTLNTAGKEKTESMFDDVKFTDGKEDSLSVSDFFDLMIAQLTNQDFMKPVDDTQYLAQLAQFSSLQAMNELSQYSKTNYATSLIGKEVTIATTSNDEEEGFVTGVVDRVSVRNKNYYVQVNGKDYSISQVTSFGNADEKSPEISDDNNSDTGEINSGAENITADNENGTAGDFDGTVSDSASQLSEYADIALRYRTATNVLEAMQRKNVPTEEILKGISGIVGINNNTIENSQYNTKNGEVQIWL